MSANPMCIWDDCDQDAIYCEGHAREYMAPDIDALKARERELVEALNTCIGALRPIEESEPSARNPATLALKQANAVLAKVRP